MNQAIPGTKVFGKPTKHKPYRDRTMYVNISEAAEILSCQPERVTDIMRVNGYLSCETNHDKYRRVDVMDVLSILTDDAPPEDYGKVPKWVILGLVKYYTRRDMPAAVKEYHRRRCEARREMSVQGA